VILKHYARQVERALRLTKFDVVFSPGTIPIAYLETDKPIVFWADATFAGMVDFYPAYTNLSIETVKNGNNMEQAALSQCRLAIYSSEWAARSALENYDVDPAKIKVVPFGANLDCNRGVADIERITTAKDFDVCKLLFVGAEWLRKGGDIAVQVAERLNQTGLKTELHVVGCDPGVAVPDFVKLHGFLAKDTDRGKTILDSLFAGCHFLILPARAECCAVVLAEASSFGLPSLATDVGGITTAVRDGCNGKIFRWDDSPSVYADYVLHVMSSTQAYERLALSSFVEYFQRLNWSLAGKKVRDLILEYCG
jgi:glycosyltransferase involved in cell wall biosynthesis